MLTAPQLPRYFPDLRDPRVASRLALVHSRFSTNTFPSWTLAHPYRMIAHNGEINTLRGNANWMRARESQLASELFGDDLKRIIPVVRTAARIRPPRQRARAARAERPLDPARDDDDDPRGLPHPQGSRRRRQGLLRLPFVPDGALGRPGRGGVHRRQDRRRHARPQRPAARPLDPGHRGLRRARVRGGGDHGRPRAHPAQGPPRPREDVPGRSRPGPDRRGRGGQAPVARRKPYGDWYQRTSSTSTTCPSASPARRGSSRCAPSSWRSATPRRTSR